MFGAFAKIFADFGFETSLVQPASAVKTRYALEVDVVLSPVNLANNANRFSRIEMSANLKDTKANQILIPYTFNSREGHTSQAEADNRCVIAAERNVNEVFSVLFSDYLTQLRPRQ